MRRSALNFWQNAELISPVLARLLARLPHGRPLTDREISTASGLTEDRVFVIQHLTEWSGASVVEMRRFLVGCRVDFCNPKQMERVRAYLMSRPNWKYLRSSPEWRQRYEPLMRRWQAAIKQ